MLQSAEVAQIQSFLREELSDNPLGSPEFIDFLVTLLRSTTERSQLLTELREFFEQDVESFVDRVLNQIDSIRPKKKSLTTKRFQSSESSKLIKSQRALGPFAANDQTVVHLKSVPSAVNTLEGLMDLLRGFGDVVDIENDTRHGQAFVKFITPQGAKRALSSSFRLDGYPGIEIVSLAEEYARSTESPVPEPEEVKKDCLGKSSKLEEINMMIVKAQQIPNLEERQELLTKLLNMKSVAEGNFSSPSKKRTGKSGIVTPVKKQKSLKLDNRVKSLKVEEIPSKFMNEKILKSHFQRFGDILSCSTTGDHEAIVEFSIHGFAQKALAEGTNLLGSVLKLSWNSE